jgi:serine/threonine protein kinase/sugar lactone lactonase YvrE
MTLVAGTRLGPYEIVSEIGVGGMGVVYKARDTRLQRDVAIKVLPEAFANDSDRRGRFQREAQAVAALSHPNIVAIFDVGVDGATAYAVTELLAGETLRSRLTSGGVASSLPPRKAIEIAVQITRGLAAAHERGLVHRDLKPENVFLCDDGQVKILDFGLARQSAASTEATETVAALTDPGLVLGTVGYMAPEQVRGLATDARTDVFAFGAVLYEMLSGRRAFKGDTAADTMTAILKEDPPELIGSRPDLSPGLDRIVRHCLEKNPAERFHAARDIAFALDALSTSSTSSAPVAVATAARRRSLLPALVAIGAVVVSALSFAVGRQMTRPTSSDQVTFERRTFDPQLVANARFMPDGQTVVFSAARQGSVPELFMIRPGAATAQPLGQPQTHLLSISSKGELAVLTNARFLGHRLFTGTLGRMPLDGAPRQWLEHVREADWSPDGSTLAIVRDADGKDHLEYPIGTVLYETTGYVSDPRVSPDGTLVAFMDHQIRFDDRGWVKVVDRQRRVTTLSAESWGEEGLAWSRDGKTVLFSAGTGPYDYQIHAVALSAPLVERVALPSAGGLYIHDIAPDGRWLADRVDSRTGTMAQAPDQAGERDLTYHGNEWSPSLSADGRWMLFTDGSAGANYATALRKTDGSRVQQLGEGTAAGLSRDGKWALALLPSSLQLSLYPVGAGETVHLKRDPLDNVSIASWFPDSRAVLVCGSEKGHGSRCYRVDIPGGSPVAVTPDGVDLGLVAPDGRTIVGLKTDGGYATFAVGGAKIQDIAGLSSADLVYGWSTDSKSLFTGHPDVPLRLQRVDVATGKQTLVKELMPPDRAGVNTVGAYVSIVDDGRYYSYTYGKSMSTLYVVNGAR